MDELDLNEAKKKLNASNQALYEASGLALFMLSKGWSLKNACSKAAAKYGFKPKAAIENEVRRVLPQGFLKARSSQYIKQNFKLTPEQAVSNSKFRKLENDGARHIKDIAKEK